MRDPYAVLGVQQDAREEEIKAAWRARAKSLHPDHNRDDPQAAARFAEVGAAYELLRDPGKRSRYDARRRKGGDDGDGQTIMQKRQAAKEAAERAKAAREEAARVMEELARANAQRAAKAAQESAPKGETTAESPEAMVNRIFGTGEKAQAEAKKKDAQPQDAAAAPAENSNPASSADPATAKAETTQKPAESAEAIPSPAFSVQAVELISNWIRRLRGLEPVPEKAPDIVADALVSIDDLIAGRRFSVSLFDDREVRVQLEPGMTDGHVVRIEGQGHRFQGMSRGDVRVTVKIAEDERFEVEGFDIHTILPVTLENAVLGCESSVETPEGPVSITIPPWSDSNRSIRIEGKGLPETAEKRGDLVVELRVVLWEKPDEKVTDLMRHMREGLYI